jgi:hypothetical protein
MSKEKKIGKICGPGESISRIENPGDWINQLDDFSPMVSVSNDGPEIKPNFVVQAIIKIPAGYAYEKISTVIDEKERVRNSHGKRRNRFWRYVVVFFKSDESNNNPRLILIKCSFAGHGKRAFPDIGVKVVWEPKGKETTEEKKTMVGEHTVDERAKKNHH